jgi:nucleoside-diphosphate-sugar epimerase
MKVVVTGGCGILGRPVVEALASHGADADPLEVTVVDQVSVAEVPGVTYIRADIRDLGQVYGALAGADAVIHLAAIRRPGIVTDDVVFETNVTGTFNIHEAAWRLGVPKVISTSSEAALGWDYRRTDFAPEFLPIDESHPLRPQDAYGLSKKVGEEIAESYAARGMSTLVLRPPWIVAPDVLEQLRVDGGRRLDRFATASYVDVRDLAEAYRLALTADARSGEKLFVVADDTSIAEPLSTFMPRMLPAIGAMAQSLTGSRPAVSNARARASLGWAPTRSWRRQAGPITTTV